MTQQQLAEKVGMGVTSLAKLEKGTRRVTLDEAVDIAAALEVSIGDLLVDPSLSQMVKHLRDELTAAIADERRLDRELSMTFEQQALVADSLDRVAHEHLLAEDRVKKLRVQLAEAERTDLDG